MVAVGGGEEGSGVEDVEGGEHGDDVAVVDTVERLKH